MRTTPPGGTRLIALYDGRCRICTREAKRLVRLAGSRSVDVRSFREPGALDPFPGITHEACVEALHVVAPDGAVFAGAEAVARLAARAPIWGWLALGYYVPGVRSLAERTYAWIARNRYRWNKDVCDPDGTCHLHHVGQDGAPRSRPKHPQG
jgi:predicted DCC family thiol-disulfide oxidoreductase YuxK